MELAWNDRQSTERFTKRDIELLLPDFEVHGKTLSHSKHEVNIIEVRRRLANFAILHRDST